MLVKATNTNEPSLSEAFNKLHNELGKLAKSHCEKRDYNAVWYTVNQQRALERMQRGLTNVCGVKF